MQFRSSPNFSLCLSMDGRAFLAEDCEPYSQYWLSETEQHLFMLFATVDGLTPTEAMDRYFRLLGHMPNQAEASALADVISEMTACGVLLARRDDTSRYTAQIVADYLTHRPIPSEISQHLVRRGAIDPATRVLDLAGGPGDLALQLAKTSNHVSLMELSRGFLNAADERAKETDHALELHHDSCNRLIHHEGSYDVITICQALHWMDDVRVCQGLCQVLEEDGHFFVIHASLTVADRHPLSFLLGDHSILGAKTKQSFADEAASLAKRLNLIFCAIEQKPGLLGNVQTRAVDISLFHQPRPIDGGFARAFMTERHIEATGLSSQEFWQDVASHLKGATDQDLLGSIDWAVIHFSRGQQDNHAAFPAAKLPVTIPYSAGVYAPSARWEALVA